LTKKEFIYQNYKDELKKCFAEKNGIYVEIDARKNLDFKKIINSIENKIL
jgi:hypothetical protein